MEVVMSKGMTTFFNRVSKGQKIKILRNILLLIPGIAAEFIIHSGLIENTKYLHLLIKLDSAYIVAIAILIGNSMLVAFMEVYNKSEKSRYRPLKSLIQAIQVISVFIGGIVIASILIDKSPTALLTGLGASAAVLMLVFKDSILGLVAGVQLSQNNMIRIGGNNPKHCKSAELGQHDHHYSALHPRLPILQELERHAGKRRQKSR